MSGGPVQAEVTRAGSSPKCNDSISEESEMVHLVGTEGCGFRKEKLVDRKRKSRGARGSASGGTEIKEREMP